jgi:glutathione peroxidase
MSSAIYEIPVRTISGEETSLRQFEGSALLIVNVASKCGFTPQYDGLEKLYETYRDKGLVVAGFPADDFAGQEPGSNEEILTFCKTSFGVQFPMFEKITVTGADKHPLYAALIEAKPTIEDPTQELRDHLIEFGVTPNEEPKLL